jgi:hypothetical protein
MAVSPQILQMIASPTSGKLGEIGATIATNRQQSERMAMEQAALADKEKTADLQRKVYGAQLEKAEIDNLLERSKVLSGLTEQFKIDAQKNPLIATDPDQYKQYMAQMTTGMPQDVVEELSNIPPQQLPQINRRSTRMIEVLSGVKEKKPPTSRKVGEEVNGEQYVVDQEYNPVTETWDEVGRSKKSAGVTVNTGQKEESKFAFQQFTGAVKDAEAAQKTKDNISYARQAMEDIDTGALTSFRVNLNRIGASFDFPVQEDIPNIAAANTAFGNMVMAGLNAFPGQISDSERKFLEGRMPNIVQTKEGREQVMELLDNLADRPIEYRKKMNDYMEKHDNSLMPGKGEESFYTKWDEYKKENPIMKDLSLLQPVTVDESQYTEIRELPDGRRIGMKADGTKELLP